MDNCNQRYPWIGVIPASWDIVRIKHIVASEPNSMVDGPFGSDLKNEEYVLDGVPIIQLNNIGIGYHNIENLKFITEEKADQLSRHRIWPGDVVMAKMADPVARGTIVSDVYPCYIISADCVRIKLSNACLPQFLVYALNSFVKHEAELLATGTTRTRINLGIAKNLHVVLPNLEIQQTIVQHLDRRTAEIDSLLADLHAQAKMLDRYKRELIADVVTSGLDKAALRKDSGADWIGKVPSHWEMTTLRAFLKAVSVKNSVDLPLLSVEREKGVVDRETEGSENNHNRIPDDLSNYKVVRTGDFVMNKMKAWRGSYGVSRYDGIVSPAYFVFALNFPNPAFFNYAIRSTKYIGFFGRDSYGIRTDQWDFKIERIKNIPFAVPPVEEQQAIVEYLDDKIPLIEGLIADINEQIEKLKQYRQIIIHDAVTGKIKVTEG